MPVSTTPLPAAVHTATHTNRICTSSEYQMPARSSPRQNFVRSLRCRPQGWLWMTIIHVARPLGRISHQIHVASATNSRSSSRGTTSHKVAWTYAKISLFFFAKRSATDAADQENGKWKCHNWDFIEKGGKAALQRGCSQKRVSPSAFDCHFREGYSSFFFFFFLA